MNVTFIDGREPRTIMNGAAEEGRETGVVKKFDAAINYGFIFLDRGSGEAFVHDRHVADQGRGLVRGERVSFVLKLARAGKSLPEATDVRVH